MGPVPGGAKEFIAEPENEDILDHFFSQVMVDTEDLFFLPVWLQCLLQLSRTSEVLAKRLLHLEEQGHQFLFRR